MLVVSCGRGDGRTDIRGIYASALQKGWAG